MTVRALIAGFNYTGAGPGFELPDCILDAERKRDLMKATFPTGTEIVFQTDRGKSEYLNDIRSFAESIGVDDVGYWFDSRHTSRRRGPEGDGWEELIVTMPKPGEEGIYISDNVASDLLSRALGPVFYITDSCHSVGFNDGLRLARSRFFGGPIARFIELEEPPEPGEAVQYTSKLETGGWRGLLHAGCAEREYSYSTGKGGAFSIWWNALVKPGMAWRDLSKALRPCLPTVDYPQTPALLGPKKMRDRLVIPT